MADKEVTLIHQFVTLAIEEEAPVPRQPIVRRTLSRMLVGQFVVMALYQRGFCESVERMDVFKETFACLCRRNDRAVKIDILVAIVCPHPDHIAFIGHDVDELKLSVKPADRRIALAGLLARFDGEAKRRGVRELKADDRMRDPGRAP